MEETYIQSRQNDQIKNLVKLRERKYRNRQERFLIEGMPFLNRELPVNEMHLPSPNWLDYVRHG